MQLLATSEQMRQFDRAAIDKYAIPGLLLMENAGRGFVDLILNRKDRLGERAVVVVCGKGNNGGDGFVIARHFANKGCRVHVALLCRRRDVRGDAKTNLDIWLKMVSEAKNALSFQEAVSPIQVNRLPKAAVLVDAIFGTGFVGKVRGIQRKAIEWINSQNSFVASVDIPSGVDATSGIVENLAVKANITAAMGLAKPGHYVGVGREHAGEVEVVDISIPSFVYKPIPNQIYRVLREDIANVLPHRPLSAHKYSVGKVFILAGSRGFTGAPFMTAQSAMRAGAGAVILGVPKSIHSVLARKVTEVMVTPLEDTANGTVAFSALDAIREKIDWADVVVLGPGLARNDETQGLILGLVPSISKPLVLDADGLNAVAAQPSVLRKRQYATILTPHVGELSRLIKQDGRSIDMHRVSVAPAAAKMLNSTVILKGAPTVTGSPTGTAYINSTGNPGMATAGAGDVLAGITGSLVAQGMEAEHAAYSAVFIHGMCGDLAAKTYGQRGLLALDLVDQLPKVFRMVEA